MAIPCISAGLQNSVDCSGGTQRTKKEKRRALRQEGRRCRREREKERERKEKKITCGNLLALAAVPENLMGNNGSPAQHLSWHNIKKMILAPYRLKKKGKEKKCVCVCMCMGVGEGVVQRGGPGERGVIHLQIRALALRSISSCQWVPGVNKVISFNPALQLYITPSS